MSGAGPAAGAGASAGDKGKGKAPAKARLGSDGDGGEGGGGAGPSSGGGGGGGGGGAGPSTSGGGASGGTAPKTEAKAVKLHAPPSSFRVEAMLQAGQLDTDAADGPSYPVADVPQGVVSHPKTFQLQARHRPGGRKWEWGANGLCLRHAMATKPPAFSE
jgi:hypothetical protein